MDKRAARSLVLGSLLSVFIAIPVPAGAVEYQLFLLAMTAEGQPVVDLQADEVVIDHAGDECSIKSLQLDSDPMKIALLVDNSGSSAQALNSLRDGLQSFLEILPAQHEIGLFTISGQARRLVDFTTDRVALGEQVARIFPDQGSGALLRDGLVETWKRRFSDDDSWPVFVTVTFNGPETSRSVQDREFNEFTNELRVRAATVHAVLVSLGTARGATQLAQTEILTYLTDATGGNYSAIAAATALPNVLAELATSVGEQYEVIKDRYRVVYECDDDQPTQIRASVNRQPAVGVSLFPDRRTEP